MTLQFKWMAAVFGLLAVALFGLGLDMAESAGKGGSAVVADGPSGAPRNEIGWP
ncbi:hypothetical protein ACGFYQ_27075 [Streptomyces sp. NPDC048258]|uniref:hypothetical protein n=1 Tax=Streptomyces sp. NPDC048258 TaxID=3365527 RepID=UPI0037124439